MKKIQLKKLIRECISEMSDISPQQPVDDWAKYEQLLKRHDWYYGMSDGGLDDYRRGKESEFRIDDLRKKLGAIDSNREEMLYKKYCPFKK